ITGIHAADEAKSPIPRLQKKRWPRVFEFTANASASAVSRPAGCARDLHYAESSSDKCAGMSITKKTRRSAGQWSGRRNGGLYRPLPATPRKQSDRAGADQAEARRFGHGREREAGARRIRNQLIAKIFGKALQRGELTRAERGGVAEILRQELEVGETGLAVVVEVGLIPLASCTEVLGQHLEVGEADGAI